MKVGTKSVLFGAHAFWLHPLFVALAWVRLYGLGYWRCSDMDGVEGEGHPAWAAGFMYNVLRPRGRVGRWLVPWVWGNQRAGAWYNFCLYHSRFLSKRACSPYSALCPADKLAVAIEPWWLYLPRVVASGEVHEYMALSRGKVAKAGKYASMALSTDSRRSWFRSMSKYLRDWAYEHRDMKPDRWTPDRGERVTAGINGAYK